MSAQRDSLVNAASGVVSSLFCWFLTVTVALGVLVAVAVGIAACRVVDRIEAQRAQAEQVEGEP